MASTGEESQAGPLGLPRAEDTNHLGGLASGDILILDPEISDPVSPGVFISSKAGLGQPACRFGAVQLLLLSSFSQCLWSGTPKELAGLLPGDLVHDVHCQCFSP